MHNKHSLYVVCNILCTFDACCICFYFFRLILYVGKCTSDYTQIIQWILNDFNLNFFVSIQTKSSIKIANPRTRCYYTVWPRYQYSCSVSQCKRGYGFVCSVNFTPWDAHIFLRTSQLNLVSWYTTEIPIQCVWFILI